MATHLFTGHRLYDPLIGQVWFEVRPETRTYQSVMTAVKLTFSTASSKCI